MPGTGKEKRHTIALKAQYREDTNQALATLVFDNEQLPPSLKYLWDSRQFILNAVRQRINIRSRLGTSCDDKEVILTEIEYGVLSLSGCV